MRTGKKLLALMLCVFTFLSSAPVQAQVQFSDENDVTTRASKKSYTEQQVDVTYEGIEGPGYGRFKSIVFDPQNEGMVYASNDNRQIFKSSDAGQNWEPIYSAPRVIGNQAVIDHLKFANPNEPTHLYFSVTDGLSTDVPTRGIYILDIATAEVVDVIKVFYIQHLNLKDYDIDPENPDNIVALGAMGVWFTGSKNTVWRSTDGGENFELVFDYQNFEMLAPLTVNIYPGNPDRMLVGLGASPSDDEGGFFGTIDGGLNWNRIHAGDIIGDVQMVTGNPETLFAVTGFGAETEKILRSTDGGMSWTEMDITLTPEQLDVFVTLTIDPVNPDNVWALEENEIVVTHDGGETWESIVFEQSTYHTYYYGITAAVNPFDSEHVIVGSDFRVVETFDNGANWDVKDVKTISMFSLDATKFPNGDAYLYYTAGGSWFAENLQTGERNESLGLNMVGLSYYLYGDPYTQDRSFMGVPGGFMGGMKIFQSETNWGGPPTQVYNDNGAKILSHIRRAPENQDIYWIVTPKWNVSGPAKLVRTMDNWATTEELTITGTEEVIKDLEVVEGQPGVLWAYAAGENKAGVYKSTDYGDNWQSMSGGLPAGIGIWDLAINPNNPDNIVASVSMGEGLYVTYDGGLNWAPSFSEFECWEVMFSKEHENVIIARQFVHPGLAISEDAGQTWSVVSTDVILDANYNDIGIIDREETIDIYMTGIGVNYVKYTYQAVPPVVQLYPPTDLTAEAVAGEVLLNWAAPQSVGEWLHYDSGENFDGVGLNEGGSFSAAIRWDADMLADYDGHVIESVRIFPRSEYNAEFVLKVWKGEGASVLLHEQPLINLEQNAWNTIELTTPVVIDASDWLWVGYDVINHAAGDYPAGVDMGPATIGYGDMVMLDGTWESLTTYDLDYNWNIQALVKNYGENLAATTGRHVKMRMSEQQSSGLSIGRLPRAEQPSLPATDVLEGYNIYRDGALLNPALVEETSYTDASVVSGDYFYYVTAVYSEGESDASNIAEVFVEGANGKLLGFIRDAVTNLGIENATLTAFNTDNGILSKATPFGSHYSMMVPVGTYDLTCMAEGYEPQTVSGMEVTEGNNTAYTFYLEPLTDREGKTSEMDMTIYPNPSNGMVNISGTDLREVKISNSNGQLVYQKQVAGMDKLEVSDLRRGLYMVTVIKTNGEITNHKLIVK